MRAPPVSPLFSHVPTWKLTTNPRLRNGGEHASRASPALPLSCTRARSPSLGLLGCDSLRLGWESQPAFASMAWTGGGFPHFACAFRAPVLFARDTKRRAGQKKKKKRTPRGFLPIRSLGPAVNSAVWMRKGAVYCSSHQHTKGSVMRRTAEWSTSLCWPFFSPSSWASEEALCREGSGPSPVHASRVRARARELHAATPIPSASPYFRSRAVDSVG